MGDYYEIEKARNLKKDLSSKFRENGIVSRRSPLSGQEQRPCAPPRRAVSLSGASGQDDLSGY